MIKLPPKAIRPFILLLLAFLLLSPSAPADELRDGQITLVYDLADKDLAERSLDILRDTLDDFRENMPVGDKPITVALCRTHPEFRRYAGQFARTSVGGVAESASGIVAIKTPRILPPGAHYEGILRHELLHLLLDRNYNTAVMPRWLNEGLAMTLSGENRSDDRFYAGYMSMRGRIIPYVELPAVLEGAEYDGRLGEAYAQSLSMTEFLRKRLGEERFWGFLRALDDRSFPEALEAHTGMTVASWFDSWQKSLWKVALIFALVSGFSAFQLMILIAALAWWRRRRRNKALLARWTEEEEEEPFLFAYQLEGREEPYPWEEEDEDRL